jgi:mandelamide amidase
MGGQKYSSVLLTRRSVLNAAALAPLAGIGGATQVLSGCSKPRSSAGLGLLALGARDAVDRIRSGDLKAEAYVAQLIEQFKAHRDLNAVVFMDETRVLEAARGIDRARDRGEQLGNAAGLPFGVKDQIAVAGYPATGGNGALKGYVPAKSAPVVQALVNAGAIVFGKTNLPDMVAGGNLLATDATFNPTFGGTHNPYDFNRLTGGSSGGNGAAIAARIIPAAIGEDTSGSVRFPAAFCGIAGLRPSTFTISNVLNGTSRKRYSDEGIVVPPAGLTDTFGPMARTVVDVAFLDHIISGETAPQYNINDVRLAIPAPAYWDQDYVDPGVAAVMRETFDKLRAAGAELVEFDFKKLLDLAGENLDRALREPRKRNLEQWLEQNLPGVSVQQVYGSRPVPAVGRRQSEEMPPEDRSRILNDAAGRYTDLFKSNNVMAIAYPTVPVPPPPLDAETHIAGRTIMVKGKAIEENDAVGPNISLVPRLGAPGLSFPAGLTNGLPVGIELAGLPGDDAKILGIGIAIESVLGRLPPPKAFVEKG